MANFNTSYAITSKSEGGYVFIKEDAGGETYAGISRRWNKNWSGWAILDKIPPEKKTRNAKFLELDQSVKEFIKVNYWSPIKGDLIQSQKIANAMFDFGVTSGVRDSVRLAQEITSPSVKPDQVMGSITLNAINNSPEYNFLVDFCSLRLLHYGRVAKADPSSRIFLNGWWTRTIKFI
jgi:lysozyme family protein